jgi:hypothetical protein
MPASPLLVNDARVNPKIRLQTFSPIQVSQPKY